jgi:putative membrane protein
MRVVIRLLVNAAALWVAVGIVPGVDYSGGWLPFLAVAAIFAVVNTVIKPLTWILTFPFIVITLGLFLLVVNGLMLWLTSAIAAALDIGFRVSGFWAAFFGALVVSIVSAALSWSFREPRYTRFEIKS